jgi:hypothetical protein
MQNSAFLKGFLVQHMDSVCARALYLSLEILINQDECRTGYMPCSIKIVFVVTKFVSIESLYQKACVG